MKSFNSSELVFPEVRRKVSPAEWEQRVNLAAAYRLASYYRMTDQIYTH